VRARRDAGAADRRAFPRQIQRKEQAIAIAEAESTWGPRPIFANDRRCRSRGRRPSIRRDLISIVPGSRALDDGIITSGDVHQGQNRRPSAQEKTLFKESPERSAEMEVHGTDRRARSGKLKVGPEGPVHRGSLSGSNLQRTGSTDTARLRGLQNVVPIRQSVQPPGIRTYSCCRNDCAASRPVRD